MIDNLLPLKRFLQQLQQVPYLASKNLYRVASHFLDMDAQKAAQFCQLLLELKEHLTQCEICFVWKERVQKCLFCDAPKRDKSIICVVENWQELLAMDRTGGYEGLFHILGGAISPLDGIGPEDLTIVPLLQRITNEPIKEIILALNQTPEGEATATYIASKLKNSGITITCLARGMPIGSSLEFTDRVTLYKALSERRPF